MSTAKTTERSGKMSPRAKARIAGLFYLLVFVTGIFSLVVRGRVGIAAAFAAGLLYVVVTLLFYFIFKPVSGGVSLLAALISLMGIAVGPIGVRSVNPLVFFGFYCLLIGYLIFRSTFLPRFLGALMMFAGLGWLTFLAPSLGNYLYPYNLAPGILGEGVLTFWLLVKGVDSERWNEQADATENRRGSRSE